MLNVLIFYWIACGNGNGDTEEQIIHARQKNEGEIADSYEGKN